MPVRLSVCPSVRPHASARLPLDGLSRNLILGTSIKVCLWTISRNSQPVRDSKATWHFTAVCTSRSPHPVISYQFLDPHSPPDPTSSCPILQYLIDSSHRAGEFSGIHLDFVFKSFQFRQVYLIFIPGFLNLLKPTGHLMHQQFNIQQLYVLPTLYLCLVFIWEQTATCTTYSINWLVFITEMKCVYWAVRTWSLNKAVCASSLKG